MNYFIRKRLYYCVLFTIAFSRAVFADLAADQQAYADQGFGMFIHFNMPTFVQDTFTGNQSNINVFNPSLLNTDQWAATTRR